MIIWLYGEDNEIWKQEHGWIRAVNPVQTREYDNGSIRDNRHDWSRIQRLKNGRVETGQKSGLHDVKMLISGDIAILELLYVVNSHWNWQLITNTLLRKW